MIYLRVDTQNIVFPLNIIRPSMGNAIHCIECALLSPLRHHVRMYKLHYYRVASGWIPAYAGTTA